MIKEKTYFVLIVLAKEMTRFRFRLSPKSISWFVFENFMTSWKLWLILSNRFCTR